MAISSILYSSLLKLETLFSRIQYDQHFFSAGFSLTNQRLFVISVILGLMALEWIFFTSRFHHGFRCNLLFNLSIRGNLVGAKDPKPIDQILAAHPCQNPQFFFLPLVCWCQHTKLKLLLLAKYNFLSERTTYEKLCNIQSRYSTLISNIKYKYYSLIQITSTILGWMVHRQYRLLVYSIIFRTPASAWIWKILY